MKEYKISHLVKSEDLNHHGTLFAGRTAEWLVEAGFIAAAATHGRPQDILCVNVHGFTFKRPVQKGDMILLCTDGLTNVLPKEKIEEIFTKGGFYDIPDRLVDAANAGGGPDNITALLLGVEPLEVKHG